MKFELICVYTLNTGRC